MSDITKENIARMCLEPQSEEIKPRKYLQNRLWHSVKDLDFTYWILVNDCFKGLYDNIWGLQVHIQDGTRVIIEVNDIILADSWTILLRSRSLHDHKLAALSSFCDKYIQNFLKGDFKKKPIKKEEKIWLLLD